MSTTGDRPGSHLVQHKNGSLDHRAQQRPAVDSGFPAHDFCRGERGAFHEELDTAQFEIRPLDVGVLDAVAHLWALESSTTGPLRPLAAGESVQDPKLGAFLTTWGREQHWIARALETLLTVHHREPPRSGAPERRTPMTGTVLPKLIGADVVAGQMAQALSREATTAALLRRLAVVADHPVVDHLCDRSLERTADYIRFFEQEAKVRLEGSPRAAALARRVLGRGFSPVRPPGVARETVQESLDVLAPRVRHRRALCREADAAVHDLPNLRGPEPLERALRTEGMLVRS